MIKPGTMCMIRGVPLNKPGGDCNGKIVQVKELYGLVWRFEPTLYTKIPKGKEWPIDLSEEKFLWPLDPCEDDLVRERLELLDEQLRETFINTVVEKI